MAGYVIYSLDWGKFRGLVERPTRRQLTVLAHLLRDGLDEYDGEFEEGDPVGGWPTDEGSLVTTAERRLALPDWYGDLSDAGKNVWEGVVFHACMGHDDIDVGFRVDSDGVYWDVIEIAWKHLGVRPNQITEVALSTFGTRPFRYQPRPRRTSSRLSFGSGGGDDWTPMHSMHTPAEVRRMLAELRSVRPAMEAADDEDARDQYENDLMPAVECVAGDGRMLFIQVDT